MVPLTVVCKCCVLTTCNPICTENIYFSKLLLIFVRMCAIQVVTNNFFF